MLRRRLIVEKAITEAQPSAALARLHDWHLHHASIAPLVDAAWIYRHNMTAADALYVVLAEHLGADFLTDDPNLVDGPTFHAPSTTGTGRSSPPPRTGASAPESSAPSNEPT